MPHASPYGVLKLPDGLVRGLFLAGREGNESLCAVRSLNGQFVYGFGKFKLRSNTPQD